MNEIFQQVQDEEKKLTWVEPTVKQLDVRETAAIPGTGHDGGHFIDCTKS